ncbi:hypothetical protein CYOC110262_16915 [Cytobacillus oceanisediminis]
MIFMGIFLLFDWMTKLTSFLASKSYGGSLVFK